MTLATLAYAFLVVAAATQHARHPPPLGLIPLTCNEVQHLVAALVCQPTRRSSAGRGCWIGCSQWRNLSCAWRVEAPEVTPG